MRPFRLLLSMAFVACASIAQAQEATPYTLAGTEVHDIRAPALNRDYQLYVSLPPSYATDPRSSYPVVFVTDAPYAFPVTRAIGARVARHSKVLPEFIVVGLSYAKGDTPEFSRRRDYTPTPRGDKGAVSDMPGRAPVHGEAEGYRRFIANEVFPFIASHYRADMSRKVIAGHSYGSLFATYVLLTEPAMFSGYILGSPSLWFDNHVLVAREQAFAATHKDLRAKVYLGVGAFEGLSPKGKPRDARYNTENDMVADTRAFAQALASRRYPGLQVRADVVADEDHLTVAPTLITRGLLWTLGAPQAGGK